ncbi:ORF6N domain protein [Candidatus Methylomirabilis lanthanidiphila]|uniref:ORF6N domain protein n=1 Tax=Candidatus Methylomirabilis lanthanidiphila TaxID=2211376 RepID=A0A564ZNC3_9BACT|nr:ORF6N domain-containing protein [Candidatus Methylomirabilis lanthanidiphila]VUZ86152.1 ORF6N domain protein [Candidatus Methylomirabilis lanthanidiphila]
MMGQDVAPIEGLIVTIRGHRVILAADLAEIYGVQTRVLNQAVKRNPEKFPGDFVFQLTLDEAETVQRSRSQIVILKRGLNIKYLPYAFTEHGAIMAANVLALKYVRPVRDERYATNYGGAGSGKPGDH